MLWPFLLTRDVSAKLWPAAVLKALLYMRGREAHTVASCNHMQHSNICAMVDRGLLGPYSKTKLDLQQYLLLLYPDSRGRAVVMLSCVLVKTSHLPKQPSHAHVCWLLY